MSRSVSRFVLVAALALSLPVPAVADANWWNASWTARRKLTFNNAAQATNLVGFPVMVRLDSGRIDYAKVQNAGQDLRFVDADNLTVLPHEIETWNEAGDFEQDVEDVRQSFLAGRPTQVLKLRELGASMRPAVRDAFDQGASLMSYVGHGGAALWASENVWNSWDVPSLLAQSRQPLLLTLNCLNGYFVANTHDALAEALLKAPGRGAIAAVSPSGLSLDGPAHRYHRALMAEITSGRHQRLGDALLAAQKVYAQTGFMPELLAVYHLLGDPATEIR